MIKGTGAIIKELRDTKLFTQEKLSEISGVSVRTIRRLEAGGNVESATLLSILEALEITLSELESISHSTDSEIDEMKKHEVVEFLQRIDSGRDLARIIANTHSFGYDFHDCHTEEQVQEAQAFLTTVADVIDIWDMVEIGQRFDLENILHEQIQVLENLNLWIFGIRQYNKNTDWTTTIIEVYSKDNPMIKKIKLDKSILQK